MVVFYRWNRKVRKEFIIFIFLVLVVCLIYSYVLFPFPFPYTFSFFIYTFFPSFPHPSNTKPLYSIASLPFSNSSLRLPVHLVLSSFHPYGHFIDFLLTWMSRVGRKVDRSTRRKRNGREHLKYLPEIHTCDTDTQVHR